MLRNPLRSVSCLGRAGLRRMCSDVDADDTPVRAEKGVNMVILLGRVGRDAERRGTESHPVVVFPLATNITWMSPDGVRQKKTEWHRISVFKNSLRDFVAMNIRKGDRLHVTGSLSYSEYTDSNGQEQRATSIIADDIVNLTKNFQKEEETYT